jgi:hypothetical protein
MLAMSKFQGHADVGNRTGYILLLKVSIQARAQLGHPPPGRQVGHSPLDIGHCRRTLNIPEKKRHRDYRKFIDI